MIMDTSRASDELNQMSEQIKEGVRKGKFTLDELQQAVMEKTKYAAQETDHYVHEHPWSMIGVAVAVGLVLGLVLNRD
jgi:ElaB/YqjD/DUF883 family membrane-anchored ribosome-binding protein